MSRKSFELKPKTVIIIIAVLIVAAVFIFTVVSRVRLKVKQDREISSMQESDSSLIDDNSKIVESLSETTEDSINEKNARENGYVYPEERIYYDNNQ